MKPFRKMHVSDADLRVMRSCLETNMPTDRMLAGAILLKLANGALDQEKKKTVYLNEPECAAILKSIGAVCKLPYAERTAIHKTTAQKISDLTDRLWYTMDPHEAMQS